MNSLLSWESRAPLSGKRKAQAFTIRCTGLELPTKNYGNACVINASPFVFCLCSKHYLRFQFVQRLSK